MFFTLVQIILLLAVPAALLWAFNQNSIKPKCTGRNSASGGKDATTTTTTTGAATAAKTALAKHEEQKTHAVASNGSVTAATTSIADAGTSNSNNTHDNGKKKNVKFVDPATAATATTATTTTTAPYKPRILITYATSSQNALTLAHKLFNAIHGQIAEMHKSNNDHDNEGAGGGGVVAHPMTPTVKILELREEDPHACSVDSLLENNIHSPNFYSLIVLVTSTFTDGAAPPRSQVFQKVLRDAFEDHRVPRDALGKKRFALFGLGDIAYGEKNFCSFGKEVVSYCRGMGAPHFVVPPVYATEAKVSGLFQIFSQTLLKWLSRTEFLSDGTFRVQKKAIAATAAATAAGKSASCGNSSGCCQTNDGGGGGGEENTCGCKSANNASNDDTGHTAHGGEYVSSASDNDEDGSGFDEIEDLIEDMDGAQVANAAPRELLNPKLRKNLEKQGYGLIGSHSGVKLCRWTKAMLRGRGGCYKHTFYAINSSQCMELTPSLACANKCIFCWRHHTNPVSTSFRWKVDPPEDIFRGGLQKHVRMINTMRGVPGVSEDALQHAFTVKHCAMSLVGEPIMYPRINEFLQMLHANEKHPERRISSFMVTNAQFPEQLRMLRPVTQLYLSIDAPTPEELKRIDRPLFEDYWERCLGCVDVLRRKRNTRTVFRLTLVNRLNDENVAAYADLVEMGWPDFIEVKGVTFCGTSHTNTINMKTNVPRHDEVITFCDRLCQELARRKPNYATQAMNDAAAEDEERKNTNNEDEGEEEDEFTFIVPEAERNRPYHIACEHEHSCCVLVSLDKFYFNRRWNTWIDYGKFFDLAARYETENGPWIPRNNDDDDDKKNGNTENDDGDDQVAVPVATATAKTATTTTEQHHQQQPEEVFSFTSMDYCAPTPAWAVYRSAERGFDPAQTRVIRKNARPVAPGADSATAAAVTATVE